MNLKTVPPQLCMSSAIRNLGFIYKAHPFPPAFCHSDQHLSEIHLEPGP